MAQTAQMNCIASNLELKTHEVSARERKSIACTAPLNTEKIVFRLKVVIIFSINGILEVMLASFSLFALAGSIVRKRFLEITRRVSSDAHLI